MRLPWFPLNTLFLPHASKVLFLAPSVISFCLFVCLSLKYLGNGWTDLRQIFREDVFDPSLGGVWMSRSKVKVQGHQGQKTKIFSESSPCTQQQTIPLHRSLGVTGWRQHTLTAACVLCIFGKKSLALLQSLMNVRACLNAKRSSVIHYVQPVVNVDSILAFFIPLRDREPSATSPGFINP